MNEIKLKDERIIANNELSTIDIKGKSFNLIMEIYNIALNQVFQDLTYLKDEHNNISSISKRIKKANSIIKKMKKKQYEISYANLIDKIDDIAGVRVVCPLKKDIYIVKEQIKQLQDVNIIEEKDYISKPKKSGYSAYHLIVETPVKIMEKQVLVKVEIQIRTMAMDFWATNEHDVRYKANKKISIINSKKLSFYAKILNRLDDKIMKIVETQNI